MLMYPAVTVTGQSCCWAAGGVTGGPQCQAGAGLPQGRDPC